MNLVRIFLFLLLTRLASSVSFAEDVVWSRTGLEVGDYKTVPILVESLAEQTQNTGLTRDRINARVNLELRKHGLKGVDADPKLHDGYLYVVVHTNGASVSIHLAFSRKVTFVSAGTVYTSRAHTWSRVASSSADRGIDTSLQTLAEGVQFFVSDYLKVNDK